MGPGIQSRPIDASRHELVLAGRLHASAVDELRRALHESASRARVLVLDASSLESVDAIALQAIVDTVKALRPRGGSVVMFGARPTVQRLLELTAVDRVVTVLVSRDEALGVAA